MSRSEGVVIRLFVDWTDTLLLFILMEGFDRKKAVQLAIGITGIYLIYSYAGLLQEVM